MFGPSKKVSTEGIPSITISKKILDEGISAIELFAMTELCATNSDARRLINQNGASIQDKKVENVKAVIDSSWLGEDNILILRAGKKRYFKVIVEK